MRFVDTNILIYAVGIHGEEDAKRELAIDLLSGDDLAVSVQVLAEFYYQATRRNRPGALTSAQASNFLAAIDTIPVQPVTVEVFRSGVSLSSRFGLSYRDGAIIAAAKLMGCDAVYTEDLSPTQDYDGLRAINPFTAP